MFDSGISVKDLVEELKTTEVDIALEIPNATYVSWLNSLQQLLYSEIIKEQKKKTIEAYMYVHSPPMSGGQSGNRKINPISLSTPDMSGNYTNDGEDDIRFEDILNRIDNNYDKWMAFELFQY